MALVAVTSLYPEKSKFTYIRTPPPRRWCLGVRDVRSPFIYQFSRIYFIICLLKNPIFTDIFEYFSENW
ncbi:hypothetical protein [Nostoc sp. TCL26-01]|uniref:hypothetical protein n=1 Tax=Nostoc sp. TCL26-01 TaxID=2576904 RepID=UPI0015B87A2B|nr:hypothetical protein [Nostoc sp. TCL26-01]